MRFIVTTQIHFVIIILIIISMATGVVATAIALGKDHTCAIEANGVVKCWGGNNYGKLGIGSLDEVRLIPVQVPGARGGVGGRAPAARVCMGIVFVCVRAYVLEKERKMQGGLLTYDYYEMQTVDVPGATEEKSVR